MTRIILIETSTALCSVALLCDGKIVSYRESSAPKAHASLTAVFVDEILGENGLDVQDCDAVCVSMGPGSYTGLRVGVSTAKGLCFGAGIPLLAASTLETLFWQVADIDLAESPENDVPYKYIVPMIDARRMEVYTAVFDLDGRQISPVEPKIIDPESFADILEEGKVLFIGDAAEKCSKAITHPNAEFAQCFPKASSMAVPALRAFKEKRFEDVAYFEPFYLKEFVATTPKKKLF